MDKTWISLPKRSSPEFVLGVENFLDFAFKNSASQDGRILCACRRCANLKWKTRSQVLEDILHNGFLNNYVVWTSHGEVEPTLNDSAAVNEEPGGFHHDIHGMLHAAFIGEDNDGASEDAILSDGASAPNSEERLEREEPVRSGDADFYRLLKEASQNLYPDCSTSKLETVVHLFHLKCLSGWSNKSFSQLLEFLRAILPEGNVLPKSYDEIKSLIKGLGLGYEKIHACPNDCMLFRGDKANDDVCSKCGSSRWVPCENSDEETLSDATTKKKPKAAKILRYFPLIPRLQRLFMSKKTAESMRWHDEQRPKDGHLRHAADSFAWKDFDSRNPEFAAEKRNVRFGLTADGVSPFKTMNTAHSTWPIILIPYNVPPWVCMKQSNFILSSIIPGPTSPGNNIDVYLEPLIEELRILFEDGVETFDASKGERFKMKAALLWTISDFPGLATLSGWSTKGEKACPCCGYLTESRWLYHGKKFCYMGHRRWLEQNHKYRKQPQQFDGSHELRTAPPRTTGADIVSYASDVNFEEVTSSEPLKRLSILYTLPYWKDNPLRHNIDMMHTEKNVFDNTYGTITEAEWKSKDNYNARCDLKDMGIRNVLHPIPETDKVPRACYQMTNTEKDDFFKVLKETKLPDEYACNISRCVQVKKRRLVGLKTYDCHILMQELLPVAIRGCLPKHVTLVIIELCHLFKCLCSKVIEESALESLKTEAISILCELEKIFPPSFFTIMVHLVLHLTEEVKLGGPTTYRWMYPVERFLLTLKNYVRNRAQPEGSMAEGYLANECLTFCSRYLDGVETRFNRPKRNGEDDVEEELNTSVGRPLGRRNSHVVFKGNKRKRSLRVTLSPSALQQAHRYILFNSDEVKPFRDEHRILVRRQNRSRRLRPFQIEMQHCLTFADWFEARISLMEQENQVVSTNLKWLSKGPSETALKYSGYLINGFRFHTKAHERNMKTQNSGIGVLSTTSSYASRKDNMPLEGEIGYYGVLREVIEVNYCGMLKHVLFKCDWVDNETGRRKDEYGFTEVNFNKLSHTGEKIEDDPYILAPQATKVFYIKGARSDWQVVKHVKVSDIFDMSRVHRLQSSLVDVPTTWVRKGINEDEIHVTPERDPPDSIAEENEYNI